MNPCLLLFLKMVILMSSIVNCEVLEYITLLMFPFFLLDIVAAAVLSGNRNFEGRVHPLTRANYLASPPLVVAYALAGTVSGRAYFYCATAVKLVPV
jgi:hypothetical protein